MEHRIIIIHQKHIVMCILMVHCYMVEGHYTKVAVKMLGKESAINMNTATKDLLSATNVYWTKKRY